MPRGVPRAGFRAPRGSRKNSTASTASMFRERVREISEHHTRNETDEEISQRINERFEVLSDITKAATTGDVRALIVYGPGGLGKSFTVESTLANWGKEDEDYRIIRGYVKSTGLYKALYEHRHPGKVIVFDDADSVFGDDIGLSFLKAACDSTSKRKISYLGEINMLSEDGSERMPRSFEFEGSIIFISNTDFNSVIESKSRLAPHMEALRSRSYYIDLAIRTKREFLVRIKQVIAEGLLRKYDLDYQQKQEILEWLTKNSSDLVELSLRTVIKLAGLVKAGGDWRRSARVTLLRNS